MTRPGTNLLTQTLAVCRRTFVFVGLFSMAINILMLSVPIYMMQIFDRALTSGSKETLIVLTIMAIAAVLTLALMELVRSKIMVRVSSWLEDVLGPEALERSIGSTLRGRFYRTESLQDIANIRNLLGGAAIFSLFDAPWVPVYLLVIFLLHPWLGVVALGGAVLLFALAIVNEKITNRPLRDASMMALTANRRAEMTTRNAEAVDAMGMAQSLIDRWAIENKAVLSLQREASDRAGIIVSMTKFFRLAIQVGILGLGAYLAMEQVLTPGGMIAASIILGRALQPVEQAIGTWRQVIGARASLRRLKGFFDEGGLRQKSMPLPEPEGYLTVEKVSFVPPGGEKPILRNISFAASPGEALAIVGPSAAGKSTLARLIVGSWQPTSGVVRLDFADIFRWSRENVGRFIGYLPQDVELFGGTVRDNIARMRDVPPEDIVKAAQMAGVHEMILRLPKGYETEIGESGTVLSAGQRQRIALARALLGEPRLVVLDEPNSNLDSEGEQALATAIRSLKNQGANVIIIAHRQSVLTHVDRILVLRNGTVDLIGTKEEVLAQIRQPKEAPKPEKGDPRMVRRQPGGRPALKSGRSVPATRSTGK
ncbi:type I secretion system permease/ATPase [Oceanibacterium hippocampi]|uniref:Type I secretion system ATP-binding protein PrsD n=1 Tax=Oceanibacterium hippocampi TaxID=745714 RepID=A0A1Y5TPD4_9PROT|nr:type I secretion system permease/ATPase [Oceanibacterium hippocampi]SLN68859.1 Type I secretion system ATP-binding protein PrsD [Oceanibacterium hippocampi]